MLLIIKYTPAAISDKAAVHDHGDHASRHLHHGRKSSDGKKLRDHMRIQVMVGLHQFPQALSVGKYRKIRIEQTACARIVTSAAPQTLAPSPKLRSDSLQN